MLSGRFENCYGIKEFDMGTGINFSQSNKAIIYAPNGVMKTSFAKVFEDLSKGEPSKDRIFPGVTTSYSIHYYASDYVFTSANSRIIPSCNAVYVVNSFADNFEFTKETVSTLLADEATRNEYLWQDYRIRCNALRDNEMIMKQCPKCGRENCSDPK